MKTSARQTVIALALLTAVALVALPQRVFSQAQALLFGSYANAAKAVTVTSAGYLNVSFGGGPVGTGTSAFSLTRQEATPAAPTVAQVVDMTGLCTAGTHTFAVGVNTATGHSITSAAASTVTCDVTHTKVTVTIPLGSIYGTSRDIYASKAGTSTPLFLVSTSPVVNNNTGTSYTFNLTDASLTATVAPTTNTTVDTALSVANTGQWDVGGGTLYLENPAFTNSGGCPACGFPLSAYGRISAYDSTLGGMQIGSMANGFANPAMRLVAIGGQWTGIANPVTAPIFQFSVASGNTGGGVIGSVGYLYEFTNSISGAADLSRWCRTTEVAIASCTTDYGGGTPDRYLFDFGISTNDLFRVSRLSFGASKTTLSAPADGQLNFLTQAETAGIGFDFATDGTVKVRNRAQNADAILTASQLKASGAMAAGGLTASGTVGVPTVVAYGNTVAATNTGTASIATITPTVDTTYEVGCNILVTTSTTHSFSCDVTYTDEGNTSRTMVLPVTQLAGTFATSGLITNVTGAGPYESPVMTIRVKASTAVTVRTSAGGTFTTVVYNARGVIKQVS